MEELEQFRVDFNAHAAQDAEQFSAINVKLDAIHATLKSTQDLMQKVDAGTGFVKWWFDNGSKLGSMMLLLIAVWLFVRYGAMATFAWFVKTIL